MTPDGAMNPLDQEILGLLADALGPETHAAALTGASGSQMQSIRTAVQSRNWRWVPLLAHISWLLAVITASTIMTLSAAALTLTLGTENHHSSSHTGNTIPGASASPPSGVGAGHSGGSGAGPGSTAGGGGTGQTPGTEGSQTTTTANGQPGGGSPVLKVTNPGNQGNVTGQPIATLAIFANGGRPPYKWSATGLPAGLAISSTKGTISGTPTTPCSCNVVVKTVDANGQHASISFAWSIFKPVAITSSSSTTFTVTQPGTFTVTATGVSAPALSKSGPLPLGVTFVNNGDGTATLSGTPARGTAGQYPITITASDGGSDTATQVFTLNVIVPGPAALKLNPPSATVNVGQTQAYTAEGIDAGGVDTGDLTGSTVFTIAPNGSGSAVGALCVGSVCSASTPGLYTITGTDGALAGQASLEVLQPVEPPWGGSEAEGSPLVKAHLANGYYIGVSGDTWTIAVTHAGERKDSYTGTVTIDVGSVSNVAKLRLEASDDYTISGTTMTFSFTNYGGIDGLTFTTPAQATSITFNLYIDNSPATSSQIFLGPRDVSGLASPITFNRG